MVYWGKEIRPLGEKLFILGIKMRKIIFSLIVVQWSQLMYFVQMKDTLRLICIGLTRLIRAKFFEVVASLPFYQANS